MLTYRDYQVAEARHKDLAKEAEIHNLTRVGVEESLFERGLRTLGNLAGGWMVELGTRMQTCSDDIAESVRYTELASTPGIVNRAEQNC